MSTSLQDICCICTFSLNGPAYEMIVNDSINRNEVCVLQCGHWYHQHCLTEWLSNPTNGNNGKCPLCRRPVVTDLIFDPSQSSAQPVQVQPVQVQPVQVQPVQVQPVQAQPVQVQPVQVQPVQVPNLRARKCIATTSRNRPCEKDFSKAHPPYCSSHRQLSAAEVQVKRDAMEMQKLNRMTGVIIRQKRKANDRLGEQVDQAAYLANERDDIINQQANLRQQFAAANDLYLSEIANPAAFIP